MLGPAARQGIDLGPQPGPGRFKCVDLGHDPVALGFGHLYGPAPSLFNHPLPISFRLGSHERALVLGLLSPGPGVAVGLGELGPRFVSRLGHSLLRLSAGRLDDRTRLLAGFGHGRIGRALGQGQHLIGVGPGVAVGAVLAIAPEEGFSGRGPLL